jgi:hypothetical protein
MGDSSISSYFAELTSENKALFPFFLDFGLPVTYSCEHIF